MRRQAPRISQGYHTPSLLLPAYIRFFFATAITCPHSEAFFDSAYRAPFGLLVSFQDARTTIAVAGWNTFQPVLISMDFATHASLILHIAFQPRVIFRELQPLGIRPVLVSSSVV